MDIFAHFLWSHILFHRTKAVGKAVLAGILPDILSWGVYSGHRILNGGTFGRPDTIPNWTFTLYGLTHSLVVFGIVCLILWLLIKRVPVYLYAWLLHIAVDIPTHSKDFLPTPFLWPVSSFAFPGIRWSHPYFMMANYTAIILCLGYIFWKQFVKKGKDRKKERR